MSKSLIISIGISIIFLANILGHYFPPFSLFTTFAYVSLIIGLVNFKLYRENFKTTIAYNFGLLLINDLLIRLFAGGNHDSAGMAWCWLMFQIGFVSSSIVMIVFSTIYFKNKNHTNLLTVIMGIIITQIIYSLINSKV